MLFQSVDSFAMAPGDSEVHFSFKTCNNTPVPIVIHWLDIKPDPVVMENQKFNFSVFLNVSLDKMIGNDPIEVSYTRNKLIKLKQVLENITFIK